MRHLFGVVAGLVLGPLVLLGLAWGGESLLVESQRNLSIRVAEQPGPLAVLVLCGLAIGFLVGTRVSPLGSLVAAVVFLVPALLWFSSPGTLLDLVPESRRVGSGVVRLGASGTALALGVAFLVPVLVPSRWRRWRRRPPSPGHAAAAPPVPLPPPEPRPAQPRWDDPRDLSSWDEPDRESAEQTRRLPGDTRPLPDGTRPLPDHAHRVPSETHRLPGPPFPPR